jgi:hypothetical protein
MSIFSNKEIGEKSKMLQFTKFLNVSRAFLRDKQLKTICHPKKSDLQENKSLKNEKTRH